MNRAGFRAILGKIGLVGRCGARGREDDKMKTILCFGDSNTWGYDPETTLRYPRGVRWTSLLQKALPGYCILEEGLGGRTTVFDDAMSYGRRGVDYLPVALETHDPVDLVLLMLGTNDCKARFRCTAGEIAEGMEALVDAVRAPARHLRQQPDILIVAPAPMDADALARGGMRHMFNEWSVEQSRRLSPYYKELAHRMGVHFFDAGRAAIADADGVHLSPAGHAALAEALAGYLPSLLGGV